MDSYRMGKSINGRKDGHVLRKIVRIRRNDGCRFRVVLFPELYFGCFFLGMAFLFPDKFLFLERCFLFPRCFHFLPGA